MHMSNTQGLGPQGEKSMMSFSCLAKWSCITGYSLTLFQGLATAAGYDPVRGPGSSCRGHGASGKCVLPWGSGTKSVNSIVLVANGVSFAVCPFFFVQSITMAHLPLSQIMTLVFTTISPAADYQMFRRWLLLLSTAICWAAQFASMSLTCGSQCLKHIFLCSKSLSTSSKPLGCCYGIVHDQLNFTWNRHCILGGTFPATGSQYTSLT
jgi:hypothetical protein